MQSLIIRVENQEAEMCDGCDKYISFEVPIQNSDQKTWVRQVTNDIFWLLENIGIDPKYMCRRTERGLICPTIGAVHGL